eukprot:jgi/Bigna1/88530/estExt_fgenesh1_pg.C_330105
MVPPAVTRTLYRCPHSPSLACSFVWSLLRALKPLRMGGKGTVRLIEPVDTQLWGRGGKMSRMSQVNGIIVSGEEQVTPNNAISPQIDLLRMVLHNTSWAEEKKDGDDESAIASMVKGFTVQSSEHGGMEGLREDKIKEIIKLGFKEGKDINDGFFVSRFLAEQANIHRCTSVAITDELVRVEGTSTALMDQATNSPQEPPTFCYRISIENVGDSAFMLLGRQWEIYDCGEEKVIAEVPKGSSGVVGLRPLLQPKERFVYFSGCNLHSSSGWIGGSFQMVLLDDSNKNIETEFDATVSPIPLEVEAEAASEEVWHSTRVMRHTS